MDPKYDSTTDKARATLTSPYDRECFDYGFHAGWHGGGRPMQGQEGEAWNSGKRHGARQQHESYLNLKVFS
jgi:hypothetical protein